MNKCRDKPDREACAKDNPKRQLFSKAHKSCEEKQNARQNTPQSCRRIIGHQIEILKQLTLQEIQTISDIVKKYNQFIIFSDFGSCQIDIIKQFLPENSYLILDHHEPEMISKDHAIFHINP